MWDLIVSVPDHCLSYYFLNCIKIVKLMKDNDQEPIQENSTSFPRQQTG